MADTDVLDDIYDAVIDGNVAGVKEGVNSALGAGHGPGEILNESMIAAMEEVGRRFEANECFVPEMLVSARAMKEGLAILRPHLQAADIQPIGRVVLGTVRGDLHDIGKNLVGMMVEGAGCEIIDLGVDVSPEKFVAAVQEHKPQILGMSALLTTTMPVMRLTMEALQNAGVRDQVKVMIGGAPVTQRYADEIGADFFAEDAASAAERVKKVLVAA
jgi:5-methyltetrahydrofolate--homocysteine methyltransferase